MNEQEVAKYKKKKNNSSKSKNKADHKHEYHDCIVTYYSNFSGKDYARTEKYCVICGKINEHLSISSGDMDAWLGGLKDVVIAKHPELPVFNLKKCTDDYVNLNEATSVFEDMKHGLEQAVAYTESGSDGE